MVINTVREAPLRNERRYMENRSIAYLCSEKYRSPRLWFACTHVELASVSVRVLRSPFSGGTHRGNDLQPIERAVRIVHASGRELLPKTPDDRERRRHLPVDRGEHRVVR